MNLQGQPERMR